MKIAAIDLGTNTFHLIIAEKRGDELTVLYKTHSPVRLGEDITKDNCIIPRAFERGLACLATFKATLDEYQVTKLRAVATSGVRSATNGQEFINAVKQQTDIAIEVIDGEEEASLIYEAVKYSGAIVGKSLIIDIGGGSTEFIFCDEKGISWKRSFDIGAARLMQQFFKSDPISLADQQAIESHLSNTLKELIDFGNSFKPTTLVGSAGAFETYVAMINPSLTLNDTPKTEISLPQHQQLSKKLINATHAERVEMPNLIPLRVDMIVMASLVTNYVFQELNIEKINISTYDLKMGVLRKLII